MLLDHCYCPYICTILKYVHHFANIAKEFEKFEYQKEPIDKEKLYSISLAKFHYTNFDEFFHVSLETIEARKKARIVSTSTNDIIEEYLSENQHLNAHIEGRLIVKD